MPVQPAEAGASAHDATVVVTENGVERSGLVDAQPTAPPKQELWLPPNMAPSGLRAKRQPNGWCWSGDHWPTPFSRLADGDWERVCLWAGCGWRQRTSVNPGEPDHPDRRFLDEERPPGEG